MYKHLIPVVLFCILTNFMFAQNEFASLSLSAYNHIDISLNDSIPAHKHKQFNAHSNMIKSIILPGLGQAANHQFWKVRVVYAGLGVCVYSINFANNYYQDLKFYVCDKFYFKHKDYKAEYLCNHCVFNF